MSPSSAPWVTYINTVLRVLHLDASDMFIMITIRCRHENVSQKKRLHLFVHSKEDQPAIQCMSTPNYFLMQQCTPDGSAARCALCVKTIFKYLHDQSGSFPSALQKKKKKPAHSLQQIGTEILGTGSACISNNSPALFSTEREADRQ